MPVHFFVQCPNCSNEELNFLNIIRNNDRKILARSNLQVTKTCVYYGNYSNNKTVILNAVIDFLFDTKILSFRFNIAFVYRHLVIFWYFFVY